MVKMLKWKIPSCSEGHWIPIIRKSKPPSWLSLVFKYSSFENLLLGERKDITKNQCEPIKRRAFLAGLIYNDSQQGLVCFQEIFVNIWTYLWLLRLRESMVLAPVYREQRCHLTSYNAPENSFQHEIIWHKTLIVLRLEVPGL